MERGFFCPKLLVVLALLLTTTALAAPEPTVGGIPLEKSVHIRSRAASIQSMIARTKPTIVWGETNMIWVDRDSSGNTLFALNRAYQLDFSDKRGSWALFDAQPGYVADGFVDFTRQVMPGKILSTDRRRGSVYLVEWTSRHITGGGPIDSARHIFLLKSREGRWRFIGEGPGSTDARTDNKQTKTAVQYEVRWTKDSAAPVIIRGTRSTRIAFQNDARQATFDSNHDFVLRGKLPARFESDSDDYLIAHSTDTTRDIALRIATCGTFYPLERTAGLRDKMLRNVIETLDDLNPHLSKLVNKGSRIILPDLSSLWDNANHAAGVRNHPRAS